MGAALFANVAGLIFGLLFVPLFLFLLVARLGVLYPRLGRWIDRRAYQAMPRLGHLFMSDEELQEEGRREEPGVTHGAVDPSRSRSAAEEAFGEQKRR